MNNPLTITIFLAIMSLLTVTLFDLQDVHQADIEARRVADIIRGIAQLQQAHYQTSNAVDPADRFLTKVQEPGFYTHESPRLSSGAEWAWFRALPDDSANKTYDDDSNRFATWATRRWLRDGAGALDNAGLPLSSHALAGRSAGARSCCAVDPGSVQVIYEARDAYLAGRVARQFGPSACLGRAHKRTGGIARDWLSYECAATGSADDRYVIVHFSAPTSLTIIDGMVWKSQVSLNNHQGVTTERPMYGDIVLRQYRPRKHVLGVGITNIGTDQYDITTPNPITGSVNQKGYLYAPGDPAIELESTTIGRRLVRIDANGDLTIGFSATDDQITLDEQGLELKDGGGIPLSLKEIGGTRTLSGVGSLHVQGRATLDASSL